MIWFVNTLSCFLWYYLSLRKTFFDPIISESNFEILMMLNGELVFRLRAATGRLISKYCELWKISV